MAKSITQLLVPGFIRRRVRGYYLKQFREQEIAARERVVAAKPKVYLSRRHTQGCQVLPSRQDLLELIPHRGVIVELGVNIGDFSEKILRICNPRELHLVDSWGSDRYHSGLHDRVKQRFADEIASGAVKIHHSLSVAAAEQFEDNSVDFVYIDTVHDYETTREELKAYAPKVKDGGFLAGHDYSMGNWIKPLRYGVIEAVHEFARDENWRLHALTINYPESPSFALQRMGVNRAHG